MQIWYHISKAPFGLYASIGVSTTLHGSIWSRLHGPYILVFYEHLAPVFDFESDPDPAFHSDVDPNPASQKLWSWREMDS